MVLRPSCWFTVRPLRWMTVKVQCAKFMASVMNLSPSFDGNDATKPPMTQTTDVMKPSTLNITEQTGNDATKPPMTQTTDVMKPSTLNTTEQTACADCSALIYIMLVMRVVEFVLITVVTVLITVVTVRHFRAR
ncbi:Hypothetical predicted protein, partial [Scomber scombrus]